MSEYTKGKWTIEPAGIDAGNDKLIIAHPNPNDFQVIRTIGRLFQNRPYDEMQANARPIAAAPTLLAACEKISTIKQWVMRIRNAPKELYEDIEEIEAAIEAGKE